MELSVDHVRFNAISITAVILLLMVLFTLYCCHSSSHSSERKPLLKNHKQQCNDTIEIGVSSIPQTSSDVRESEGVSENFHDHYSSTNTQHSVPETNTIASATNYHSASETRTGVKDDCSDMPIEKPTNHARNEQLTIMHDMPTLDSVAETALSPLLPKSRSQSAYHTKASHETRSELYDPISIGSSLTPENLNYVSTQIWEARPKWFYIGLELELTASDLESIKVAKNNEPGDCFTEMLNVWLRRGNATWGALINALKSKKVDLLYLAKSIEAMFCNAPANSGGCKTADSTSLCAINKEIKNSKEAKVCDVAATNSGGCEASDSTSTGSKETNESKGVTLSSFKCLCGECTLEKYLEGECPSSSSMALFPYLDRTSLTESEYYKLERTLMKETEVVVHAFTELLASTRESLKKIDPKDIVSDVMSIAQSESSTHSVKKGFKVRINDANDIIIYLQEKGYISFFNYYILEYLIGQYGSSKARQMLDTYAKKFQKFCQRSVFKVPQRVFGEAPVDSTTLAIKILPGIFTASQTVDDTSSAIQCQSKVSSAVISSSKTLNFTLNNTRAVQEKIADALNIEQSWALVFLYASKGCVELTFALPKMIMNEKVKDIFDKRDLSSGLSKLEKEGIHILCGPPGKPVPIHITNDSISLQWTKPEYQGYHTLTHYCIFYRSPGDPNEKWEEITTRDSKENIEVKGLSLKEITNFIFKVKAVNKIGAGVESIESDLIKLPNTQPVDLECPLSLKWEKGMDMPFEVWGYPQIVVVKNKAYIGGGEANDDVRSVVIVYDLQEESCYKLPPYTHQYFAMATINNKLFLIGGEDAMTKMKTNKLGVWNEKSNQWTDDHPYPPMISAGSKASVITYHNRWLIVIGGLGNEGSLSRVEILNITLRQWYHAASLPYPCYQLSQTTIGNMCYLLGGFSGEGTPLSTKFFRTRIDDLILQQNDLMSASPNTPPIASPWQTLPADIPVTQSTASSLNDVLIAVGGGSNIYHYKPSTKNWVKAGELPTARSACACSILPGGKMLVAGGGSGHIQKRIDIASLL